MFYDFSSQPGQQCQLIYFTCKPDASCGLVFTLSYDYISSFPAQSFAQDSLYVEKLEIIDAIFAYTGLWMTSYGSRLV